MFRRESRGEGRIARRSLRHGELMGTSSMTCRDERLRLDLLLDAEIEVTVGSNKANA